MCESWSGNDNDNHLGSQIGGHSTIGWDDAPVLFEGHDGQRRVCVRMDLAC